MISIAEAIDEALDGHTEMYLEDIDRLPQVSSKRLVTTGGHYAYLKIAEGCDKHCTYCVIPKIRGNFRSVPMEQLLKEAEGTGRRRCEGTDPCSAGDYRLRTGYLWRKVITSSAQGTL